MKLLENFYLKDGKNTTTRMRLNRELRRRNQLCVVLIVVCWVLYFYLTRCV